MTVARLGPGTRSYTGLHADVKPASDTGALFYETDTGDWFIYDGASWVAYEYPLVSAGDPASGDLDGTYPNPTVAALHTGATKLTVGAVADGEYLKRVGETIVGAEAGGGPIPDPLELGAAVFDELTVAGQSVVASGIQYVDVQLNNAQILNLKATPIELIPAPVPGFGILFRDVYELWHCPVEYTDNGAPTDLIYKHGTSTFLSGPGRDGDNLSDIPTDHDLLFAVTNLRAELTGGFVAFNKPLYHYADTEFDALALKLANVGVAEFGGGGAANTLSLRIWYSIVPTGPFGA